MESNPLGRPRLLEWAHRRAAHPTEGSAVDDLLQGKSDTAIAEGRGLPRATVVGIRSFYDQVEPIPRVCDGTACHFSGSTALRERLTTIGPVGGVRCLGHCYAAPAFRSGDRVFARPRRATVESWLAEWGEGPEPLEDLVPVHRESLAEEPVVFRHLVRGAPPADFADYDLPAGEAVLAALEAARLRGRGGAAYPTAAKWKAARDTPAPERWVVANGDEGDPGSYVDRLLLEEDPQAILAGMLACGRAIGARRGVVYIRAEYPRAQASMREAIGAARQAGHLGKPFDVEVISGAGSYVCGEETALLRSIEGLRGEPRPKPPFPAQAGLFGLPTVVQNVETLSIVPWIARTGRGSGTKAVSVSGAVRRPGAFEVSLGIPLRRVLEEGAGGAPAGRRWTMALVGGPMGRVLPERWFDRPLSYEALPGMGHAGVVVLDETVSPRALAEHLFAFARAESCGTCTPCRVGTAQLAALRDRSGLGRLLDTLEMGSLCGFGQGVPRPIRDLLEHFGDAVLP
ncbi:MAG TPA: NADH-ubiquinone oxidoreductase-F iron-sulfur binding region domain-containing protein [Candidatus Eisenbacteria bacterium]